MIGGSAMAFSPSFVGRGRQSCPTRKHRAHPSLDTTQNRAVAFHPATGTSWSEVNPAAVRTDGGPGSRFLRVTNSQQSGLEAPAPLAASSEAPRDRVSNPQPGFGVTRKQRVAKRFLEAKSPRVLEEVLSVVLLDGDVQFHRQARCRHISRQLQDGVQALRSGQAHVADRCPHHNRSPFLFGDQSQNASAPTRTLVLEVQGTLPWGAQRPKPFASCIQFAEGKACYRECESSRFRFVEEQRLPLGNHSVRVRRGRHPAAFDFLAVDKCRIRCHVPLINKQHTGESHE